MKVNCPLCKTTAEYIYRVGAFRYYKCIRCYSLFLNPQPTDKELNEYYKNIFSNAAGIVNKEKLKKQAKKVIRKLLRLNPKGKTILDIGSGLGYLLEEAHQHGLKTTAIEPSKRLVKRRAYKQFDNVYNLSFEEYLQLQREEKFDFILLTQVIEHIKKPKRFIKNITGMLNKNGILFVETPNLDSHLYRAEREQYTFLTPPEHVFLFSIKGIVKLLPKSYFIEESSTYSYPEHLVGIIKRRIKKTEDKLPQSDISKQNGKKEGRIPITKKIKLYLFDKFLARIFYPLLNLNHYGSVIELYIKEK